MVNPDRDPKYMKETHGTVGLITDYGSTAYIEKAKKEKDVKPLTKWR
ncbi:MAG: hypothetical protein CM15mV36_0060 [Caudoviricetes sp.]|jgi:hypothetical protein|nr:MAG: hypothetical protein CM15mV36_0060 [Caudoviricetes sp.]|tara:strand:- start:90 stop:230 length:141 start_codon:yes stop_codon:yes gene_type:complete